MSATLALFTCSALAQEAPRNIDERYRSLSPAIPEQLAAAEAILSGDSDLVLLRRTRLFTVRGGATANYTSNAFLSPNDAETDRFAVSEVGVTFATKIAERVDVFADIGALDVRYDEHDSLDYQALSGAVGVQTNAGPIGVALLYQPSRLFDDTPSEDQLTQHRLRLSSSYALRIRRLVIEPSAGVERVWSNPEDYRNWAFSAQTALSYPLTARLPLAAVAWAGVERREYDSYFRDLVGSSRNDNRWYAGVALQWRPAHWADLAVRYTYADNHSTSDVNGYRVAGGQLGLSASMRF